MKEPIWINETALRLLHGESLAQFGGLSGTRDNGLLLSALARPKNLYGYSCETKLSKLAAAYAYGLSRNHPFTDGNKRITYLTIGLFLAINGKQIKPEPVEAVNIMFALAQGEITEKQLADWIEVNIV